VFGAHACLSSGTDFSIIGDKTLQGFCLLVIDRDTFISTKLAFPWAGKKFSGTDHRFIGWWLICHIFSPSRKVICFPVGILDL
jgi:hypothetical protein